ncbi:MAG: leucine-rich repeat domain-containing protein [Clostridia bacterium]|nr:leucine-rich repeat domain-containing protein [Clostridia bacterium]
MKKKLLVAISATAALCCAFFLSACGGKNDNGGGNGEETEKYTQGLTFAEKDGAYSVTKIGTAKDKDIIIPSEYNQKPVTAIADSAFFGCDMTSITIPDSVTSIGDMAFYRCEDLTHVNFGNGVTSIGTQAFYMCLSLKDIAIPDGVTSIADETFSTCRNLASVSLGGVTSIGKMAFYECRSLTSITIPEKVTVIGDRAFLNDILTFYCEAESKPDGWHTDWNYGLHPTVWNCKNNQTDENGYAYTVVNGLNYAIKDGKATLASQPYNLSGNITVPDTVTYNGNTYEVSAINHEAFFYCKNLTGITIPDSITFLSEYAFSRCSALTSISLPNTLTRISYSAFMECSALADITFDGTKDEWNKIEKASFWDDTTGDYTVHCTDEDIAKI